MKKRIFTITACLLLSGALAACAAPELPVETPTHSPTVSDTPDVSSTPDPTPAPTPTPTPTPTPEATVPPAVSNASSWDLRIYADGTLTIPSIGNLPDWYVEHTLFILLHCLREELLPCSEFNRVCVGDAVLEITTDLYPTASDKEFVIRSASACGHTITLPEDGMSMYGDFKFQAFETEDGFILSNRKNGCGTTYIFTPDGVTKLVTTENIGTLYASGGILHLHSGDSAVPISCAELLSRYSSLCTAVDSVPDQNGSPTYDPDTPDWSVSVSSDGILTGSDADEFIWTMINKLDYSVLPCDGITEMVINGASVQVSTTSGPYGHDMQARAVTAFGHTVEFAEHEMDMYGNLSFNVISLDHCFVIYSIGSGGSKRVCMITPEGTTQFTVPVDTDGTSYNASYYSFHETDGQLYYTRTVAKFENIQAVGMLLDQCVGRDEFCRETGTVTFDGATPVYHPTKTETISDVYDLDAQYEADCKAFNKDPNEITLDEFLAANALIYQRAH